jgi:hypothetical protein
MAPADEPTTRRRAMRAAALVLGVVAGAAIGIAAMPYLFKRVPSELGRIAVLLTALESAPATELLVFGNSVAMAGVDAGKLRSELGIGTRIINVSFPAQTLAESFLFYQEIPRATRTLVYVLSPTQLESDMVFNTSVPSAFRLSGFEPKAETVEMLEAAFPPAALRELRAGGARMRFEGRWIVRHLIDAGLRQFVRRDLDLERAASDLEFPSPYRERIPDWKFELNLRSILSSRAPGPLRQSPGNARLLEEMVARAGRDGRRLLLVLAPMHPRFRAEWGDTFLSSVRSDFRELESQGAQIVDALELLGDEEFLDPVHPSRAGADRLTRLIVEAIRPD